MAKKKCIYKCDDNGICARSTCEHHCLQVNDEICNNCFLYQSKVDINPKFLLKQAIRQALKTLPSSIENQQGKELLYEALKIQ